MSKKMEKNVGYRYCLKLLLSALVPLLIAIFTIVTTIQQQRLSTLQRDQDKQDARLLRELSERQTENLQKENIFTTYLNDISKLLLSNDEESRLMLIRAKTLASLRQLDFQRKKHLLFFLYDNELIRQLPEKKVSSLLKINDADFSGTYLQGTIGSNCIFSHLYLLDVHLSNASFSNCYIGDSDFAYSKMYTTAFLETRIARTSFKFALLDQCIFAQSILSHVTFFGASLVQCNFTSTTWKFTTIDFTNTNLTEAVISKELLSKSVLDNAVLPNGAWGPIHRKNLVINGDAEQWNVTTNSTSFPGWNISVYGIISAIAYNQQHSKFELGKYHFRVTPSYRLKRAVSMSQYISLENFTLLISANISRYNASIDFQCWGDQQIAIILTFADFNRFTYSPVYRETKPNVEMTRLEVSGAVHFEIRTVQLKITFFTSAKNSQTDTIDENYCIVDNIEFYITKHA